MAKIDLQELHTVFTKLKQSAQWWATPEGIDAEGLDPVACERATIILDDYMGVLWGDDKEAESELPSIESVTIKGGFTGG